MTTTHRRARSDKQEEQPHLVRTGSATGARVRLSVYDLVTGPISIPRVFYYRRTLDGEALRASLSRVLRHYPLVTGRLKRDPDGGMSVLCDDSGVLFVESALTEQMPDPPVDEPAAPDLRRFYREWLPFRVVDRDQPLLTVKLTHMAGGGSVLGVAINHSITDGAGLLALLENWSHEHRGLEYPPPCEDRRLLDNLGEGAPPAALLDNGRFAVARRGAKLAFVARLITSTGRLSTVTVHFTPGEIDAMKAAATAELLGTGRWVSANDAFTAHLWQVLGELRARPGGSAEKLGLVVGLRSVFGDTLPPGYWGNPITNAQITMTADELRTRSLAAVAEAVRGGLGPDAPAVVRDEIAFLAAQREAGRSARVMSRTAFDTFDNTVGINNRSRFPYYRIDLGEGAPFRADFPAIPVPWMLDIMPTPTEDGGRLVHMRLPRAQADALREQPWQARLHAYAPARLRS
jgi:shikimate O-hydroxycinnamoyltransferase